MLRFGAAVPAAFLIAFVAVPPASAQVTPIAAINAVDEDGLPVFPGLGTMDRYTIEGVALNDGGVFNAEGDASLILFVQDETGGIQVYSGSWYGGGLAKYPEIHQGDRVRATGLTGHFGGKTNINERHNPDQTFDIEILSSGPDPEPMPVGDLATASAFDPSRRTGGEYYQGRLVVLKNVRIVGGAWENGGTVTAEDPEGGTLPVELRFHTGIGDHPQPEGPMDIVGVFNQEDTEAPFTGEYRLWPRSINDFIPAQSGQDHWDAYR